MTADPGGVRVAVRLVPRAARTGIDGWRDGRLVVRVTAAPVDGAANEALVRTLADALDVPQRALRLVAGTHSRQKMIEVIGLPQEIVEQRIAGVVARR